MEDLQLLTFTDLHAGRYHLNVPGDVTFKLKVLYQKTKHTGQQWSDTQICKRFHIHICAKMVIIYSSPSSLIIINDHPSSLTSLSFSLSISSLLLLYNSNEQAYLVEGSSSLSKHIRPLASTKSSAYKQNTVSSIIVCFIVL